MAQQSWTDDPLVQYTTKIKAVHFDELMDAVNAWETAYVIANTSWTQDEPSSADTVQWVTIQEMEDALDSLRAVSDCGGSFSWTPTGQNNFIPITDITEVRTNMNYLQANCCYLCHTCDTDSGCDVCDSVLNAPWCDTCDDTCNAEWCDACDSACNAHQGCSLCDDTCYSEDPKYGCTSCDYACFAGHQGCQTCNNACNTEQCTTCNNACHAEQCTTCNNTCHQNICTKCHVGNYEYPWT